jgi:hypothetical protein
MSGLLEHIFERLCRADLGEEIFGADEAARWPEGALEALLKSGFLGRAEPAQVIECDGCERNCFMPVHIRPAEGNRSARAFISCDKPEDVGRVPVELARLAQWRITGGMLASAVALMLGFTNAPLEDGVGKRWTLGRLKGKEYKGLVTLSLDGGVTLTVADQSMPLANVLKLNRRGAKSGQGRASQTGGRRYTATCVGRGVGRVAHANRESRRKRKAQPAGRQPRQAKADTRDMGHGEVFIPRHLRGTGMRGPGHVFLCRQKSSEKRLSL